MLKLSKLPCHRVEGSQSKIHASRNVKEACLPLLFEAKSEHAHQRAASVLMCDNSHFHPFPVGLCETQQECLNLRTSQIWQHSYRTLGVRHVELKIVSHASEYDSSKTNIHHRIHRVFSCWTLKAYSKTLPRRCLDV